MIMHISTIKSFDTNINHQVIILIITKALRIKSLDSNLPVNLFFFVLCETNDYCGSLLLAAHTVVLWSVMAVL